MKLSRRASFVITKICISLHIMRSLLVLLCSLLAVSCTVSYDDKTDDKRFTVVKMLPHTPVKDQGESDLCWAYAMLATIESDRIGMGDSVNLSPHYLARMFMGEQTEKRYLCEGKHNVSSRGMMTDAIRLINKYGMMPYESYKTDGNIRTACRMLNDMALIESRQGTSIESLREKSTEIMDETLGSMPYNVYMYGVRYTTKEFALSVCMPHDYAAFTSFTHAPFYEMMRIDVPDNYYGDTFLNIPLDSLLSKTERAIGRGYAVCWEGDISNEGFSFHDGTAVMPDESIFIDQQQRQTAFSRLHTNDDHSMAIIGTATDRNGNKFFICKNSWGTDNPFGGIMYMSYNYFRLNTIAVVMRKDI